MSEPAIDLRDVRFRWRDDAPWVIDGCSFAVGRAEAVFLAGPSGSGKSTLLALLAGIAIPTQGEVRVLGRPLGAMSGAARDRLRADRIGVIFQLFNLLPYLSVVENVTLPCLFSPARRAAAAARGGAPAEARRLLDRLGLGDAELQRRKVGELSVGQQQRVAAARALIGAPAMVLADEPTSALDAELRIEFVELLLRECAAAESAVVFVSHDRSLAARFARRLEMPNLARAAA
ncbi:MAG: ABC transporter ATP-binding protein [Alphaproteobacteria bacterium]|nr:ABC transporter ATP-binding protein [Alphaproteobacteria bacterium]